MIAHLQMVRQPITGTWFPTPATKLTGLAVMGGGYAVGYLCGRQLFTDSGLMRLVKLQNLTTSSHNGYNLKNLREEKNS